MKVCQKQEVFLPIPLSCQEKELLYLLIYLSVTVVFFFPQITCIKQALICTRVSLNDCPYSGLGASSVAHVYLALGGGIN